MVRQAIDTFGGLDVLVNNAGFLRDRMLVNATEEEFDAVTAVHLKGHFATMRHAAAYWRAQSKAGDTRDARIINTSSGAGILGSVGQAAYSAAKAGTGMAAKVMALELAGTGITVNAVAPGHIATPMTGKAGVDPATVALPQIPAGRPGGPEEIAALVAWVASDAAAYVTGASILADGGLALSAVNALQDAVEGRDTAGSGRARGERVQ
jgi:NAD(P)-dependent dehydrogenase (short-subunit alcohol dehydrogenase family)